MSDDDGTEVKIIVGTFWDQQDGVDGIGTDPQYLDIFMPAGIKKTFKIDTYRWAFAYVFEGAGAFTDASAPLGFCWKKKSLAKRSTSAICLATAP